MRRSLVLVALLLLLASSAGCGAPKGSALRQLDEGTAGFEIELAGNEQYKDRKLLKAADESLRDFIESGFRKYAVDDAAYSVQLFYQERGFPFAVVGYELVTADREQPLARLNVREGPRTHLLEIQFEGNVVVEDESLAKLVPTKRGGLFGWGKRLLVESLLDAGRGRIEGLYYERGYLEVEVGAPEVEYSEDRSTAVALYRIQPGPQHVVRSVELVDLPDAWQGKERQELEAAVGQPYFPRVGYDLRARVQGVCANNGHPDAEVALTVDKDPGSGDVHLTLAVDPREVVTVRSVEVRGNERTRAGFIRNQLRLKPGDEYDQAEVERAFKKLYRTGIFQRVRIFLEEGDEPARDMVIEVDEGPAWDVYFEPGWGSYERARIAAGVLDRNVFGTGRQVGLSGSLSERAQRGELQFTDRTILGPRDDVRLDVYAGRREEPSFTRTNYGTGVQLKRAWSPRLDTIVRYDWQRAGSTDIQVGGGAIPPGATDDVNLSIVTLSTVLDNRDSKFLPTTGAITRGAVEISNQLLGSELSYFRLLASHFRYFPLGERSGLVLGLRTGILFKLDDFVFPLQLRFFNGGEHTVRSFREQQLGPKDAFGNPVGGEAFNVLNIELRRMLVSRLQGVLFLDAGNVPLVADDYLSFTDIRAGVGVGLRWLLPIGPLRLDFAVNPDPRPDELSYVLHFSLGTAF